MNFAKYTFMIVIPPMTTEQEDFCSNVLSIAFSAGGIFFYNSWNTRRRFNLYYPVPKYTVVIQDCLFYRAPLVKKINYQTDVSNIFDHFKNIVYNNHTSTISPLLTSLYKLLCRLFVNLNFLVCYY